MKNEKLYTYEEVATLIHERLTIERKIVSYYSRALDIALATPGANRMECLNQAIHEIDGRKDENELH